MEYYAHSTENTNKSDWQKLKVHLENTAQRSEEFAEKFNQKELGRIAGLFHDLGKYSEKFQDRLKGGPKVDHATAGAKEVVKLYNGIGEYILAHCIAGHHGGLIDTGSGVDKVDLKSRLKKEIEEYSHYTDEFKEHFEDDLKTLLQLKFDKFPNEKQLPFSTSFLTRMLYSCLVDADWLDTGIFYKKIKGEKTADYDFENIASLNQKLSDYFENDPKFKNKTGVINKKRNEIRQECLEKSKNKKGLYSLTVPTGGGKTLSSLAFALNHAIKNEQKKIIYAIPYTSIIEQNAEVFRGIFGEENVLEHHSNYIFEDSGKFEKCEEEQDKTEKQIIADKLKYASENWDAPIIATTNVQFFESLFASKKSRCRKLHNIANSVIILDEAQMLPTKYLIPCVKAIGELVNRYNCTVVLCTATQPPLNTYFKELGIEVQEIMSDPQDLFKVLKRVEVQYIGRISDDDLIAETSGLNQVLTIVNTKRHAKELYEKMITANEGNEEGVYHLSTFMCPVHRKQIIAEIKKRLKDENKPPTKVFSTQLIEAGVDIDFPYVYRSAAGLDSIAQAAGRCNREGRLEKGIVKVFESAEKHGRPGGSLKLSADVGGMAIDKIISGELPDALSDKAIKYYFNELYFYKGEEQLGAKYIEEYFKKSGRGNLFFEFKTAAKEFRFIDNNTKPVVIPFDEKAEKLIVKIRYSEFPKKYLRALQPYTVNLYEQDYNALAYKENINDVITVLTCMSKYDEKTGIIIDKDSEAMFV